MLTCKPDCGGARKSNALISSRYQMKRCPNCNRTYANDAQKFCTKDGTSLVGVSARPGPGRDCATGLGRIGHYTV
jgi:hypothetical protein